MAINSTASDSKGRNVAPLSSTLHIMTMDVDCSALTDAPLDGEWVIAKGRGAACGSSGGVSSPNSAAGTPLAKADANGAGLRMVWSEKGRSDLQATGRKRVPVIWMGGMHCKLSLYNYDSAALPQAGDSVYVAKNSAAVDGTQTRLVADCASGGNSNQLAGWCVGIVVADVATAGDPLEVMLFDQPRITAA
jgi:hypothetical protein